MIEAELVKIFAKFYLTVFLLLWIIEFKVFIDLEGLNNFKGRIEDLSRHTLEFYLQLKKKIYE